MKRSGPVLVVLALILVSSLVFAQRRGGGGGRGYGRGYDGGEKTPREMPSGSTGTPNWTNTIGFEKDVFTFARIRYTSSPRGSRSGGRWNTDTPDSDLNFSFRLQQMTSLKVNPDGCFVRLTEPDLHDYPWIYIVEPGRLEFDEEEVKILRKYLLNGGFLMVDDFWGQVQWQNFYEQIKRVFPDRDPVELPMDHPIFHCVFDLKMPKSKMQIPAIQIGRYSGETGVTWEYHDGEECRDVHFKAIFDDKQRMMVFICHNTDNGDGWEREGENEYYFKTFSEKIAYPLGINAIFYATTH